MHMYRYIDIPDPTVSPPIEHLIAHQEALLSRILVPTDYTSNYRMWLPGSAP